MMKRLCLFVCLSMGAAPAFAQLENLDRFERQLEQINRDIRLKVDTDVPAGQRALIDYGVYATFGFLAIDDPLQNTHILRQTDINAYVRINVDDAHEFYMRVLQRFTDWNTGDSFDGNDEDTVEAQFERIHYRFDLAKAREAYDGESINYNFVIQGGRQLVHWANGLALSQVLDGGSIVLSCENISLELMAGATRPSSVDFDPSRPGFAGDTHRDFYGAKLELQTLPEHRIFVYALKQHDSNHNSLLITDPIPGPIGDEFGTAFEYNSHYIGIGSTGNLGDRVLYSTEFVLQGGDSNSTSVISAGGFAVPVAQTQDDIDAYAFDIKIEYLADDSKRTRATLELLVASSDDDRLHTSATFGGNLPGTDDQAFNGFGLINTGLAFSPVASNLVMVRGGVSAFPMRSSELFKNMQVGIDVFLFHKEDKNAPIDELTKMKSFLGTEADLFMNWQVTSDMSVVVRYGVFFPGSAIVTDKDPRHFLYTGITLGL